MGSGRLRIGRPLILAGLLGLVLAAGPLLLAAHPAQAATTFVVTTTGDNPDADLTDDRCDTAPGPGASCSLRAAIQEANATPGPDTIAFNIPGGGLKTIRPGSELPAITEQVTINGYTQPGSSPNTAAVGTNAVLRIELDGSNAGASADGFQIDAGANTLVRGLIINRFAVWAVRILGGTGTRIAGCFLGTDAAGTAPRANLIGGVAVAGVAGPAANVTVGGAGPAARNLISANGWYGVSGANRVLGNLIGTDRTGAAPLGNGKDGVNVAATAAVIGGDTPGEANVIAFNGENGVELGGGEGNRFLGNSIFANAELGINLSLPGVTPNDFQDPDTGPNTLQNFPVIAAATSTGVTVTLNSTPHATFALRLFSNPGAQNEGKVFEEGPATVTTDANGDASHTFAPNPPIPVGRSVTATATNSGGSTSEFSAAMPVTGS